jgi:hypothetical protein
MEAPSRHPPSIPPETYSQSSTIPQEPARYQRSLRNGQKNRRRQQYILSPSVIVMSPFAEVVVAFVSPGAAVASPARQTKRHHLPPLPQRWHLIQGKAEAPPSAPGTTPAVGGDGSWNQMFSRQSRSHSPPQVAARGFCLLGAPCRAPRLSLARPATDHPSREAR